MSWTHIDFWFTKGNTWRVGRYLNKKEQKDFENLVAWIIHKLQKYIHRKFYLYEDIPHCFLALEIVSSKFEKIEKLIKKIKRSYIYQIRFTKDTKDESNGEGFLNILDAFTDFYLFKKDNRITHIIHCCMEFMMQTRQNECQFYQNMATLYQVVKRSGKKIVYGYKKFTPSLRKKLKRYIKELDLE